MQLAAAAGFLAITLPLAAQSRAPIPQAPKPNVPAAPAPAAITFPPVNPENFTVTSPSVEDVNGFLKSIWGYEPGRTWSVVSILGTPAPGVAKITVLIADKAQPGRMSRAVFFTTPDGKHVIADEVMPFGPKPFAENRAVLQARADGPARGASGKDLMLVEFADLQCGACREAATTMDNLAQDFPQARIVFQYFSPDPRPLVEHAIAEGMCVRKAKGDAAFFDYAQSVYAAEGGLAPDKADATLNTAAAKAGADPAAVAACSQTAEARQAVSDSLKLAHDIGVSDEPMLAINGHLIPLRLIPYEVLKRIVVWQANQDGVAVTLQPSLRSLK
ncbi:MAG TPA: thioredoxin domain-containing protein [Acidobacteriaceae bacterium]|jgi:protein-disulfide isomerase